MNKKKLLKYLVLGIVATLIATFLLPSKEKQVTHPRDYHEIAGEGAIHVATEYNSISFFVNGDTLSGFHYELIEAFARDHSLKTVITPEMSFEKRLQGLAEGKFDVIAYDVLATSELKDSLLLTHPIALNKEVLVQATYFARLSLVHQKSTGTGRKDTARSQRRSFDSAHPQPEP